MKSPFHFVRQTMNYQKQRGFLITVVVLFFILLFAVPFLFDDDFNQTLIISASLLSSFASLITLIIALVVLNKFGIEKTVLEKQTEAVLNLIESIKEFEVSITNHDKTHYIFFRPKWKDNYSNDEIGSYILRFGLSYFQSIEPISKQARNIFLPREIVNKCILIDLQGINYKQNEDFKKILFVSKAPSSDKEEEFGAFHRKEDITYREYTQYWEDVLNACKKWLNNNSSVQVDLNML